MEGILFPTINNYQLHKYFANMKKNGRFADVKKLIVKY